MDRLFVGNVRERISILKQGATVGHLVGRLFPIYGLPLAGAAGCHVITANTFCSDRTPFAARLGRVRTPSELPAPCAPSRPVSRNIRVLSRVTNRMAATRTLQDARSRPLGNNDRRARLRGRAPLALSRAALPGPGPWHQATRALSKASRLYKRRLPTSSQDTQISVSGSPQTGRSFGPRKRVLHAHWPIA